MCSLNVLFLAILEKGKLFFRAFQGWSAREVKPSCPKGNLKQEKYQTACKPGSVSAHLERRMAIHLGRPLPDASCDLPGRRRENPLAGKTPACRPYLVLLPVGFTVPSPLPGTRCALTAPFHPCRRSVPRRDRNLGRRFAFCGTVPRVAPAGRYPAPCFRGARTFLPRRGGAAPKAAIRPSGVY